MSLLLADLLEGVRSPGAVKGCDVGAPRLARDFCGLDGGECPAALILLKPFLHPARLGLAFTWIQR